MKLENATILVTGANRGIGKALVETFLARRVVRVYAAVRDPSLAAPVVALDPTRVIPLTIDVTSKDQISAAAEQAKDVTILVNNAGVLGAFDLLTTPLASLQRDFHTNFFGTLAVTQAFLPALQRASEAAIVNILTVVSLASMPALGGYSASKAAAFSMTQALRAELQTKGIHVHAVFPGPVDTDMSRNIKFPKTSAADVAQSIADGIERNDDDILPDPMSLDVFAKWKTDPKELERQFASM